jgi:GTP-binding protein Era
VVDGEQGVGPGDRFLAHLLESAGLPVVVAVNKVDRLDRGRVAAVLTAAADELTVADDVFPVSARRGTGVVALAEHLGRLVPEGPYLYPPSERTDLPEDVRLAELVREQVLRRTFQEVPHAVAVELEEVGRDRADLVTVRARVLVETESQKGILIGRGGKMIRAIGTAARRELERELGAQVHLDLRVEVRRRWRTDDALLDRLGIE